MIPRYKFDDIEEVICEKRLCTYPYEDEVENGKNLVK